jgi:ketosteroid isomerase-like protein
MTLEQKVHVARKLYEAVRQRDLDCVMDWYHPGAESDFSRSRALQSGIYRGTQDIRRAWEETLEPWKEWLAEPFDFVEIDDDRLLFSSRARMTGRDGIKLQGQSAHVWTFREGRVAHATFFQSRQEAEAEATRTASGPGVDSRDLRM